jgi:predicted acylesterase/phospholipase RssA
MADGEKPELRLGLVLYGGVSLAVYIYGVVVEVQRLLGASAEHEATKPEDRENVPGGYAEALRKGGLSRASVDIIAGTSAGGINGILLAKALATGADVTAVKDLWIEGGDIAALLRRLGDDDSSSLLSTEVMQNQLAEGFGALDKGGRAGTDGALDLFVSATHLRGDLLRFKDSLGAEVETLKHRYVFHLKQRPEYGRNDFIRPHGAKRSTASNAHLVKLSRATSAFPVAFEPVEIVKDDGVLEPHDEPKAWFADGGILNNKPFTEALQTIFTRSSDRPVRRWLLSVDPDPKAVKRPPPPGPKPAFDQVALSAVTQIPRYQSIAHDLESLEDHNAAVGWVAALVADMERDLSDREQRRLGPPPPAYRRMRARAWAEEIADRLMLAVRPDEPGRFNPGETRDSFLSAAYRVLAGPGGDGEGWLEQVDLAFELRRAYYLIKLIGMAVARGDSPPGAASGPDGLDSVRSTLWNAFELIANALWESLSKEPMALEVDGESLAGQAYELVAERIAAAQGGFESAQSEARAALEELAGVSALLRHPAPEELGGGGTFEVRLDAVYEGFALRDFRLLPIQAGGGLRHRDLVAHAQISPATAKSTGVKAEEKLAGDTAGHFGGFLDREWRRNDLLWGRLDAAEILVGATMSGSTAGARKEVVEQVHREILAEELPQEQWPPERDYTVYLKANTKGDVDISTLPPERVAGLEARAAFVVRAMVGKAAKDAKQGPVPPQGKVRRSVLGALDGTLKWAGILLYPWFRRLRRRARKAEPRPPQR